jgi:hypothetical protein
MTREGEEAMQIGFGWNLQRSAYQNITAHRTRLANYASSAQSALSAASNLFASASSAQIEGMAKLAAQQAVTRLQAQIKQAVASRDKQLAHAQNTLQATQSLYNSSGLATTGSSTGNAVSTSA